MSIARMVRVKHWVAWILIAGGLTSLGTVALDLARAVASQRRYHIALHDAAHSQPPASASAPASASIGEPIGWLEIPRIALSAAVVHGDSDALLKTAIGHLPDTPLPWSGGNSAFAGHRDSFFRPLRHVRPDDIVRLETPHGDFHYRIRKTFIVRPEDLWVLDSTPSSMLTLITCYPFDYVGTAPRRFIVRAERVDASSAETTASGATLKQVRAGASSLFAFPTLVGASAMRDQTF